MEYHYLDKNLYILVSLLWKFLHGDEVKNLPPTYFLYSTQTMPSCCCCLLQIADLIPGK